MKYVHFNRSIDASVNQKSRTPITTEATWTAALPFLTANFAAKSNWTFYFQYAKGMYVPDLSSFYSSSPSLLTSLDGLARRPRSTASRRRRRPTTRSAPSITAITSPLTATSI